MQQKIIRHNRSAPFLNPSRVRMTPTFYHHDIFNVNPPDALKIRYTPTFASNVVLSHYPRQQTNRRTASQDLRASRHSNASIYVNESIRRKQAQLNPCGDYYGQPQQQIDLKQKLYDDVKQCGNQTSRLRKMVDLMSNPVFNGCTLQITTQQYDPKKYARPYQQQHQNAQVPVKIAEQAKNKNVNKQIEAHPQTKIQTNKTNKKLIKDSRTGNKKPNKKHQAKLGRFKSAQPKRIK